MDLQVKSSNDSPGLTLVVVALEPCQAESVRFCRNMFQIVRTLQVFIAPSNDYTWESGSPTPGGPLPGLLGYGVRHDIGDMKRGKAEVCWKDVCLPKNKCGLGVQKIETVSVPTLHQEQLDTLHWMLTDGTLFSFIVCHAWHSVHERSNKVDWSWLFYHLDFIELIKGEREDVYCSSYLVRDTPNTPPSQDPYEVTVARWRSRVAASSSAPPSPIQTSSDSHSDTSSYSFSIHSSSELYLPCGADLLSPRKRIRDSDLVTDFEVSSKDGYVPYVPREVGIDECFTYADAIRARGTEVRIVVETAVKEESVREDVPDHVTTNGDVEVIYETLGGLVQRFHDHTMKILAHRIQVIKSVQRDLGHMIVATSQQSVTMSERIDTLDQDNVRLQGITMPTATRSEMTQDAINELIAKRNPHKRTVGVDDTYAIIWKARMKIMTEVYYGPEEEDKVEKYIGGLLDNIQGNMIAAKPVRLQNAICIANNLMDQKLKGYAIKNAENKRRFDNNSRDNHGQKQQPFKRQNVNGQNVARAYTVENNVERRGCVKALPYCNKCILHHEGSCTVKCGNYKRVGHMTKDCRTAVATTPRRAPVGNQTGNACYKCERKGHYRNECPKLRNQNCGNKVGNKNGNNEAKARAYAIGGGGADPDLNVIMGMFLINNCYAFMLFYSGADRSFVSTTFSALLDVTLSTLDTSYAIELADGRILETNVILRGCTLGLLGHPFDIYLMLVELGSFDVIVGMDWLAKYHMVIVFEEKIIRIPYGD
uniref:Reverse transcriptase domain-containing protein n=1 Tax=Tanacetum cinerariifolium TaxID=118510 RepID=A0A6L2LWJ0_TANCI|nr:reverse transcriptase domain-containing protein [Tanacetum cinerariifolium]